MTAAAPTTARTSGGLHLGSVAAAELTLPLVTLATVAGFARLYDSARFFVPLMVFAVAGHGLATICRRLRLSAWVVAGIAVIAGILLTGWLLFPSTTALGLPTSETLHAANASFDDAMNRFSRVLAPAPVLPGFQLSAALAIWAGVWFSDWSAFRIWATAESVAPAAVLFMFGAMLGAPDHRAWTTALFIGAVLLFVLCHRTARQELGRRWVSGSAPSGRRWLLAAGGLIGLVAVGIGLIVGPQVPGAGAKALLAWRRHNPGDQSRVTVSPLVDIRKRLVDQSDTEAFTVRADRPAYWRLTSLDEFNGRIWSSSSSYALEGSRLEDLDRAGRAGVSKPLVQRFHIEALDALWMPGAFIPTSVSTNGPSIRADSRSQTLIVDTDRDSSNGLKYTLTSEVPSFTPDQLRRSAGYDGFVPRAYRRLPSDFMSTRAARIAREVTANATSRYDRALALQRYFRENFTYSLENVAAGHDESAIDQFLTSRRGYCEQFAGTYAAMARSIGLPSRVAVGFTPGDRDPDDPTLYHVKGKHAHAWPEVWLGDAGWVPFEPTPGRGAPDGQAWTGVTPQQDSNDPLTTPTTPTTVPGTEATPTTAKLGGDASDQLSTRGANLADSGAPTDNRRQVAVGVVVGLLGLAVLGWLGLVVVTPLVRRRRAAMRAHTNPARIGVQWSEGVDAVTTLTGASPRPYESHAEFAHRVTPALGPRAALINELARLAAAASWSGTEASDDEVDRARQLRIDLHRAARHDVSLLRRTRRRLSLRRALGRPIDGSSAEPTSSLVDRWRAVRGRPTP